MAKKDAAGAAKKPPSVGDFVWDRLRGRCKVSKVNHSSKGWHVLLVDAVTSVKWYRDQDEGEHWHFKEPVNLDRQSRSSRRAKSVTNNDTVTNSDDDRTDDVDETQDTESGLFKLAESVADGACLGDSLAILKTLMTTAEHRYPCEHMLADMISEIRGKNVDDLVVQYIGNVTKENQTACAIAKAHNVPFEVVGAPVLYRKCAMRDNDALPLTLEEGRLDLQLFLQMMIHAPTRDLYTLVHHGLYGFMIALFKHMMGVELEIVDSEDISAVKAAPNRYHVRRFKDHYKPLVPSDFQLPPHPEWYQVYLDLRNQTELLNFENKDHMAAMMGISRLEYPPLPPIPVDAFVISFRMMTLAECGSLNSVNDLSDDELIQEILDLAPAPASGPEEPAPEPASAVGPTEPAPASVPTLGLAGPAAAPAPASKLAPAPAQGPAAPVPAQGPVAPVPEPAPVLAPAAAPALTPAICTVVNVTATATKVASASVTATATAMAKSVSTQQPVLDANPSITVGSVQWRTAERFIRDHAIDSTFPKSNKIAEINVDGIVVMWGGEKAFAESNAALLCHSIISCNRSQYGFGKDEIPDTNAGKELTIKEILFGAQQLAMHQRQGLRLAVHCLNGRTRSGIVVLLFLVRCKNMPYDVALMKMNTEMARVHGLNNPKWRVDREDCFTWFVKALSSIEVIDLKGCLTWHANNPEQRPSRSSTPNNVQQLANLKDKPVSDVRVDVSTLSMFESFKADISGVSYEGVWGCVANKWPHPRKHPDTATAKISTGGSILVPAFRDNSVSMTKPEFPIMTITISMQNFFNFLPSIERKACSSVSTVSMSMILGVYQRQTRNIHAAGNVYQLKIGPRGPKSYKVYIIMLCRPRQGSGTGYHVLFPSATYALCYWVTKPERMTVSDFADRKRTRNLATPTKEMCFVPVSKLESEIFPLKDLFDLGATNYFFKTVRDAATSFFMNPHLHDNMLPIFQGSGERVTVKFPIPNYDLDDDDESDVMTDSSRSTRSPSVSVSMASSRSSKSSTKSSKAGKRKTRDQGRERKKKLKKMFPASNVSGFQPVHPLAQQMMATGGTGGALPPPPFETLSMANFSQLQQMNNQSMEEQVNKRVAQEVAKQMAQQQAAATIAQQKLELEAQKQSYEMRLALAQKEIENEKLMRQLAEQHHEKRELLRDQHQEQQLQSNKETTEMQSNFVGSLLTQHRFDKQGEIIKGQQAVAMVSSAVNGGNGQSPVDALNAIQTGATQLFNSPSTPIGQQSGRQQEGSDQHQLQLKN